MEILENEKFGGKRKIVNIERRAEERFTRMKRKHQHRHISKKHNQYKYLESSALSNAI